MKDIKCNKCCSNKKRLTSVVEPEECSSCFNNPEFKDNFTEMEKPWPPEEGQDVWCISAIGLVIEKTYYHNSFLNLCNAYPTEEKAKEALITLSKARKLII